MKLYTEEQIKEILEELQKAFLPKNIECDGAHCIGCWKDVVRTTIQMANSFTPIQLPSDEEIFNKSIEIMEEWYGSGCKEEIDAHFRGAKWVIKQIKQQEL